jgi:S-DNA-T family DNA segregation ATPase FtsK/SpoIIIE
MSSLDEKQPLMSASMRAFLMRRLAELVGFIVLIFGSVFGIILFTADQDDPSFNTASGEAVSNWFGQTGAHIASLSFQVFGLPALLLSVTLFIWGCRMMVSKHLSRWRWRLVLLPISVLLLSGATQGISALNDFLDNSGFGGILIFDALVSLLGRLGTPDVIDHQILATSIFILIGLALYVWVSGISFRRSGWAGNILTKGSSLAVRQAFSAATKPLLGGIGTLVRSRAARSDDASGRPAPVKKTRTAGSTKERKEPRLLVDDGPVHATEADDNNLPTPTARRSSAKRQEIFDFETGGFKLPPVKLLTAPSKTKAQSAETVDSENAMALRQVLEDFRIQGELEEVKSGPVVTRYGLNPAPGTRSQRVIALADDIARSMSALAVRVAVVPGQNVIGIELPNEHRDIVLLRHIFDHPDWSESKALLPLALGKDIAGAPVIADLARMPHLLVAGTTGSGKSVGINGMILSLLYRYSPEECRLIMIDPKMLELSVYDGIPHLLSPVVTDPSKAVMALKWAVREMENRYRNMAKMNVRNIAGYNERLAEARAKGEVLTRRVQTGFDTETGKPIFEEEVLDLAPLPFIVVLIDEVADLMLVAGKEIESAVQRLAQMARAAGIHVIMATQRPSVDVITGTIKANFPTRISFQVTSKIDSRTILGEQGAEQLLGRGDMLFMEGGGRIVRVHGPFVDDHEVEAVANFLRQQGEPDYNDHVTEETDDDAGSVGASNMGDAMPTGNSLYDQAVALVIREQKASTSFVQRHLKIGYNRAATLIEEMETAGIISGANHVGKRDVLVQNDE